MVAMQVGDENVLHVPPAYPVLLHLYLRAFAAINEDVCPIERHYLRSRVTTVSRQGRVVAENSDFHGGCNDNRKDAKARKNLSIKILHRKHAVLGKSSLRLSAFAVNLMEKPPHPHPYICFT